MKKKLLIACCLICMMACADNDFTINFNSLPQISQQLLTQYANPQDIILITKDGTSKWAEYEVKMSDQSEWEFDADGQLKSVEIATGVPTDLIPNEVVQYVQTNYPGAIIIQYSKGKRYQEVELNNGLELKFNMQGQLLEID